MVVRDYQPRSANQNRRAEDFPLVNHRRGQAAHGDRMDGERDVPGGEEDRSEVLAAVVRGGGDGEASGCL
jgi:hypothetical protein